MTVTAPDYTAPATAKEKVFPAEVTAESVQALLQARAKTMYDMWLAKKALQEAEPYLWWDLLALGPFQNLAPGGPLPPHQVIKVGQMAYIGTILVLNPQNILPPPPGISPWAILSPFGLSFEIQYQTGNLTTWGPGPAALNVTRMLPLSSFGGGPLYVDVLPFTGTTPGLMEMNISARIVGPAGTPPIPFPPLFAGFARAVYDFDPELLFHAPTPGFEFDMPIKFMIYP